MSKPRLTEAAVRDRRAIRSWFRQAGAGPAARVRLDRLERAIDGLADAPYAHPTGPRPGTRMLISQKHRILFRTIAGAAAPDVPNIEILRIFGPGQSDT